MKKYIYYFLDNKSFMSYFKIYNEINIIFNASLMLSIFFLNRQHLVPSIL
jgi:hypothetical protein